MYSDACPDTPDSHCLEMTCSSESKNFVDCLQNCRHLLNKLERSIHKTGKYEARLRRCKASHAQCHNGDEEGDTSQLGLFEAKESMSNGTVKLAEKPSVSSWRSPIDLAESWSTMSIVCLQYQYEELSKRYESLLRAYDERCAALSARDASLQRLRGRVENAQAQLASAHGALLSVGERYLTLRCRKLTQQCWYENKIQSLREKLRRMLSEAERARLALDHQLAQTLSCEHDTAVSLLLAEIKKCNLLFLENMRLKVKLEEDSTPIK